ncbi:HDOD domain-containing protein [Motiliproteus sp. SC1-56]|uniref:HDOD domain-containing protein n=1 Tax=Motiliproteus sp. SC1-56 TaxID=2799565 RepID=UPI001A8D468F|nr:HDOD domain-containing protein [Motiliproteus sp. SC1-56]
MFVNFWKSRQIRAASPPAKPAPPHVSLNDSRTLSPQSARAASSQDAPPLPVLGDKELLALYRLATVKPLAPGEVLHREDDPLAFWYWVVKGSLQLAWDAVEGSAARVETLEPGGWFAEADLSRPRAVGCRATACSATSVALVDERLLGLIDDRLKLALLGTVHGVDRQRIRQLGEEARQTGQKNAQLIAGLMQASHRTAPDIGRSKLVQALIEKVPRLPDATTTLIAKLVNRRSSTREIVELVKSDPALTAEVLKTVNSSCYRFENKIADVNHAVVLLGYDGIYQMLVVSGVRHCLPDTQTFHQVYETALGVSSIAFVLSQECRQGQPAELATIGLLHQVGLTVIELLKERYPQMLPLIGCLESADMGAALLRAWGLPETVCSSIELQRYPEYTPPAQIDTQVRMPVAILYLSRLCYRLLKGEAVVQMPTLFLQEHLALLDLKAESLQALADETLLPRLRKQRKSLPVVLRQHLN